jgi:hypothetical protein
MYTAILMITAVMAFDPALNRDALSLDTVTETVTSGSTSVFKVRFAGRDYVVYDRVAVAELHLLFAPQPSLNAKQIAAHAKRVEKRLNVMMPPLIARGVARPAKGY